MTLDFLDRDDERKRLAALLAGRTGALAVLYGRRRLGKSRLLREVLPVGRSAYYMADDRESVLQRAALAGEIARILPGFDRVTYPEWDALFTRFWARPRPGRCWPSTSSRRWSLPRARSRVSSSATSIAAWQAVRTSSSPALRNG